MICNPSLYSHYVYQAYLGLPSEVEGMLPTEIGLLSNLSFLDLYRLINLQGGLPSQLIHLSSLSELRIVDSFDDDEILFSSFLSYLPPNLEALYLRGDFLVGQIPSDF